MAYNNLSGTVLLPDRLTTRLNLVSGSIISGNLDYSDGANVVNVPRVSNATNNAILTNVGGDANTLTCESNLTFDGTSLNITGDLTASVAISASFFEGDGSRLTNLPGGGGGSGAGIFTEVNASAAYTTSSVNIGSNATPAHTLSVVGTKLLSGNVDIDGHMIPTAPDIYDLGSSAKPWRDLYISGSSIHFGNEVLSVADNNLKFGSGSTTKGFDVGFMNLKNNGIFMDPGRLFKLRAYQIQMFGGIGYVRRVVADDYTIQNIDYLIGIQSDTLSGPITLTLPDADTQLNGQTFVIKDEGGAINTHSVTVSCSAGDTIDGQNQVVLESPYASISIYCNGLNKYFIY
jgi:hypothetical protein